MEMIPIGIVVACFAYAVGGIIGHSAGWKGAAKSYNPALDYERKMRTTAEARVRELEAEKAAVREAMADGMELWEDADGEE